MIQNCLLTTLAPLRIKNEFNCWENRPFTTVWPVNVQQKKRDITRTIKKKQKRVRTAFSTEQLRALERTYSRHKYIDSEKRAELASTLNIGDKCIKIWFQNRRMKEKRESSESSCDSSGESVSNETLPVPVSPPLQVTLDQPTTDYLNKFSHQPDHAYQLPAYYNTNPVQSDCAGLAPPGFATYFYNDSNVYPTQYYPYDVNYANSDGNGYGYNQYGSEVNNCWASNQYPYYSTI